MRSDTANVTKEDGWVQASQRALPRGRTSELCGRGSAASATSTDTTSRQRSPHAARPSRQRGAQRALFLLLPLMFPSVAGATGTT